MKGKVIFVTGAAAGIGAASAVAFARLGARLALTDKDSLDDTVEKCHAAGASKSDILTIQGDLTEEDDIHRIVNEITSHYNRLDVVANVAGFATLGGIDGDIKDLDFQYKLTVRAPYLLCQKLVPYLTRTKGCILNVSSTASRSPDFSITAYCTMKAGLDHLSRCLAAELASKGIRVNSINPGGVATKMPCKAFGITDEAEKQKLMAKIASFHPLKRCADASELAEAVVFLCDSTKSGFITGTNMLVDGGWMLRTALPEEK